MTNIDTADQNRIDDQEDVEHIKTYPWLYWLMLILLAVAYGTAGWILSGGTIPYFGWHIDDVAIPLFGTRLDIGYLVWMIGILHFIAGFDIIKRNEIAGVFFLGYPTKQFSGAFIIAPPGLFQQEEVTALIVELPWPEDAEKVFRGGPDEKVPPGWFLPIRILFTDAPGDERGSDPSQSSATHEVSLFVRIRVSNFFDFYARIGDTDLNIGDSEEYQENPAKMLVNARAQIGNMSINLINQLLTKLTLKQAQAALIEARPLKKRTLPLQGVDEKLEDHIKNETKWWGIDVVTARLKLIEPSKTYNQSIQTAALGAADARGAEARAKGEKAKRTLEGEGTANAVRADIDARTAGLQKQRDELKIPMETILAAQVARDIANGSNEKIILPGFEGLTKVIDAVANGFKTPTPPTQPTGGNHDT